jgi:hypothetical protein
MLEAHQIPASEVRLQISLARAILESMKVEIAAAHLATVAPPVTLQLSESHQIRSKKN